MPLSSQRQRVSIFVSPRNEDFLFYEKVDKQRVQESVPEYGEPHPDFRKYPNHFFAQAVQADDEGQVYYYYYAAKREHQDDYNFEHTTVNHKSGTYDQVERSYVTLRSEYDEDSPALGSAMPIVDADPFEESDQYTLISREQSRIGETVGISSKRNPDEMDSMFVIERRIYLKRVPITTTAYDKRTGSHVFSTTTLVHRDEILAKSVDGEGVSPLLYLQPDGLSLYLQPDGVSRYAVYGSGSGYLLEKSYSVAELVNDPDNEFWEVDTNTGAYKQIEQVSEEWFFVTSVINGDANKRRVFVYLTPNQNDFLFYELVDRKDEQSTPENLPKYGDSHPDYTDHKFVAAAPNDDTGDFYRYYYAKDRFKQDEYNFSESFVDIGGVRISLVRRSYVTLREDYNPTSPEVGASMPSDPNGKFTGEYLLVDRAQRPIEDETLSSLYVSEEHVYAKTPDPAAQDGNLSLQEGGLTVTRTWIVPRSQVGAFPRPAVGTPDSKYGQYEYATRRISQDTPAEIDSYYSVVLDIYAKKGWAFQEEHQYNIGYKIIETTTLEDDKDGEGNYTVSFDERGWQRRQRSAELTGFEYESQVETRPYGKITTNRSAGTEPIVSGNNTRSQIVFDDGTLQIYQRDEDTFTIKEGSAGQEKNEQVYASITTNKFYRSTGDVLTDTGSSRVIYDDGTTQVYEVSEESVQAKEGDAGQTKEEQIYATITTNSKFSTSSAVSTDTGRSRVVYRGGGVIIYQVDEEYVQAKEGDAGQTKEEQIYATITTNSKFSTSSAVSTDTGRSRVVYRGGGVIIYQVDEESVQAKEGDAGQSKEEQIYATITTNSKFSTSSAVSTDTGRSRVVYRGGGVIIYQVDEESVQAKEGDAGQSKEEQIYATITTNSRFSTSSEVSTDTGRSRVVYRGGGVIIYQVDEESVQAKEGDAGQSKEEQIYATITTNSRFSTSSEVSTDTGRSRVVYRGGGVIIYQVDEESVQAKEGDAGQSKEEQIYATITTNSRFSTSSEVSTDTGRSRVVYRGGGVTIYQVDEESVVAKEGDAGQTKEEQIYATITTNSRFSTSSEVSTDTGRSRVVYRGGGVIIYQVDEESVVAKEGDAGQSKEARVYGTITTNSRFSTSSEVSTDTGRSRVVYRGGGVIIYQVDEESLSFKANDNGETRESTIYATITTTSTFATSGDLDSTGNSRLVYNDGTTQVYQVDEVTDIEPNSSYEYTVNTSTQWGHLEIRTYFNDTGVADNTSKINRIRTVYRGEVTGTSVQVFQIDEETPVPNTTEFTSAKESNQYFTSETFTKYDKTPNATPANNEEVRNTSVYNNESEVVYRVDRTVFSPEPAITYESTVNKKWPAVLAGLSEKIFSRRDGTSVYSYFPTYEQEEYSGPCRAIVTETWSKEAPTGQSSVGPFLKTTPVFYVTPLFRVSIPPCLHQAIPFIGTTGTTSDTWEYLTWNDTIPATPQTTWVDVVISDEVSPFQGGFLKKTVTCKPPV